ETASHARGGRRTGELLMKLVKRLVGRPPWAAPGPLARRDASPEQPPSRPGGRMRPRGAAPPSVSLLLLALSFLPAAAAEDWPEWRGQGRQGVWRETGILETFPEKGLEAEWRTPVRSGFAGPAVAAGRVFVLDFSQTEGPKGIERAMALDEKTGAVLWTREWEANYTGLASTYAVGPRATPTIDGERVYTVGASGILHCLNAKTGAIVWKKDYVKDYGTHLPVWGMTGAPLVDGERLIALV